MKIAKMDVTLIDSMGSDLSVCNAARVSFDKESDWEYGEWEEIMPEDSRVLEYHQAKQLSEKDQKLRTYLAKHDHWSPFAHAFLSFRIKAPIFVARQLGKHQVGLSWNEVSRRYVSDEPEFYLPKEWRGKPENAKQGSSNQTIERVDVDVSPEDRALVNSIGCLEVYKEFLNAGIAPEQARMVLPQNTMTSWIWSGSLAAFTRVCKLRLDPHSQEETREVAQMLNDRVPKEMQHSWNALMNCKV